MAIDINNIRIASPCTVGWDTMKGGERERHYESCNLNVYNIAEMTANEFNSLISRSEGRVCARIYRRADGTVLTKDCPVGLRAYRKRVSRFAGATLAAILGLFSIGFGQKNKEPYKAPVTEVVKSVDPSGKTRISGIVTDITGAVIVKAEVFVYKGEIEVSKNTTNDAGEFDIAIEPGTYRLKIFAPNFFSKTIEEIDLTQSENAAITAILEAGTIGEVVIVTKNSKRAKMKRGGSQEPPSVKKTRP